MKTNYKMLKSLLTDVGIGNKKCKIFGESNNYYIINVDELKDVLKDYNLEEEELVFGDDEFE